MNDFPGTGRPAWIDGTAALLVGFAGQAITMIAFARSDGALEPVRGLLLPGAVGAIAALVTRRGASAVALMVGIVGAASAVSLVAGVPAPSLVDIALATGAAGLGFAAVYGIRASSGMPTGLPTPLSRADRERFTAETTQQLRSIDPNAAGSFEQSIALLRQVNEQLQAYGMYGPWNVGSDGRPDRPPAELVQVQAELIEAARLSAMAAGARRVTITSAGMGVDVQAIFGDPIVGDLPRAAGTDPTDWSLPSG